MCGSAAQRLRARTDGRDAPLPEDELGHDRRRDVIGTLTPEEIDEFLRSETIGRIGCYGYGRPYVVPITYAYDGDAIYGHAREGLKLRMMRGHPSVCFEVDRSEALTSWRSVVAFGTFSELEATQAGLAMELLRRKLAPLVPSATSVPDGPLHASGMPWSVFRILLGERTGRFETTPA
jgi:nitroimidazol reductase NimA-like FMN-containing flavoprotein (pyridoxamine 5'-phosphate oxidase superfamily)